MQVRQMHKFRSTLSQKRQIWAREEQLSLLISMPLDTKPSQRDLLYDLNQNHYFYFIQILNQYLKSQLHLHCYNHQTISSSKASSNMTHLKRISLQQLFYQFAESQKKSILWEDHHYMNNLHLVNSNYNFL